MSAKLVPLPPPVTIVASSFSLVHVCAIKTSLSRPRVELVARPRIESHENRRGVTHDSPRRIVTMFCFLLTAQAILSTRRLPF
jgi:hypothetical protein